MPGKTGGHQARRVPRVAMDAITFNLCTREVPAPLIGVHFTPRIGIQLLTPSWRPISLSHSEVGFDNSRPGRDLWPESINRDVNFALGRGSSW